MSKLLYIAPGQVGDDPVERGFRACIREGTGLDAIGFTRGPGHLEYGYYETLVLPDLVHTVMRAEEIGYDAAIIGCFYDLGLHTCREMTRGMVITAPCESSTLLAASLGDRFSIIVGRTKWIPQMRETVSAYGLASRLASFRILNFGVLDYHVDEARTARRFEEEARKAVEEDGAEVIILGCTASVGFARQLQAEIGVPVIDSGVAAIKHAEHLVELRRSQGLSHSKVGRYESPPQAEIDAWDLVPNGSLASIEDIWHRIEMDDPDSI